jgi:hypothetical protein
MSISSLLTQKWQDEETPDLEGIVCANGDFYKIKKKKLAKLAGDHYEMTQSRIVKADKMPKIKHWLSICRMAQTDLYGGKYRVVCGEAANHGAIGFVVLESIATGAPIWTFASEETNPFDQIEIKGSHVLVLSTCGAIFRFKAPHNDETTLTHLGLFL